MRELQAHHEARRAAMKETHNEIYNDFENIRTELEAISIEFNLLTDHQVTLDANFSKFGYNAHLRTKDLELPATSPSESHRFNELSSNWNISRQAATSLKFWRTAG